MIYIFEFAPELSFEMEQLVVIKYIEVLKLLKAIFMSWLSR